MFSYELPVLLCLRMCIMNINPTTGGDIIVNYLFI